MSKGKRKGKKKGAKKDHSAKKADVQIKTPERKKNIIADIPSKKKHEGIRILSIGTDRSIFKEGSDTQKRIIRQAKEVEEMHIIVFSKTKHHLRGEMVGENVFLYPTNSFSRWFYISKAYFLGRRIAKRIKKENLLITAQDAFETGVVGYLLSRYVKRPFQLQIHTDFFSPAFVETNRLNRFRVAISQYLIPKAAGIRVVSKRVKDSIIDFFGPDLEEKVSVLPVYIDINASLKHEDDLVDLHDTYPQFEQIMVVVSRLEEEKNVLYAIDALSLLVDEFPDMGLVIVGEGSQKEMLKERARLLGLSHNVKFEGFQTDVWSYYKSADVFLNTSDYEGYGRTLVEAAAIGCPIVTTDVGIVGEVLVPGKHLLACDLYDIDCVVDSVTEMVDDVIQAEVYREEAQQGALGSLMADEAEYFSKFKELWMYCLKEEPKEQK